MKTSTPCTCHTEPDACATGVLERPRYFPRQLLTPAELTLEQQYFRDKLRRHNRLIHGWGVVCGAAVCRVPEEQVESEARRRASATDPNQPPRDQPAPAQPKPWKVRVTPGYLLGPYGDEILIDRELIVDLRTCGQTAVTGEHGEPADPWCADVYVQREPGPLFVAVRYKELQSRPVRVQPAGCGCDDTECEYSRWRDGYEICVLTECPSNHESPPNFDRLFQGPLPDCPACPPDPWVVLARVEIEADGTITELDNCSCRRLVVSFGPLWWQCTGDACAIRGVEVEGGRMVRAGKDIRMKVAAYDLPEEVDADLEDGIEVTRAIVNDEGTLLVITAKADDDARPGSRTLTLRDRASDRVIAARRDVLTIRARPAAPSPPPPPSAPPSPSPGAGTRKAAKPAKSRASRPRKKKEEPKGEK